MMRVFGFVAAAAALASYGFAAPVETAVAASRPSDANTAIRPTTHVPIPTCGPGFLCLPPPVGWSSGWLFSGGPGSSQTGARAGVPREVPSSSRSQPTGTIQPGGSISSVAHSESSSTVRVRPTTLM